MDSPKAELSGIPGLKVLETLRRNLFDMQGSIARYSGRGQLPWVCIAQCKAGDRSVV